jgi:hypothetical protein
LQINFKEDYTSNILQCFHAIVVNKLFTTVCNEDSTNNTILENNAASHMYFIQTKHAYRSVIDVLHRKPTTFGFNEYIPNTGLSARSQAGHQTGLGTWAKIGRDVIKK